MAAFYVRTKRRSVFFSFIDEHERTKQTKEERGYVVYLSREVGGGAAAAAASLDDVSFNENPTPGPAPKIEAEISTQLV
jgi:hypothetical protein